MKILNIFGLVVAVHAAVFLLIFAIPGCRSAPRDADAVVVTDPEPTVVYRDTTTPRVSAARDLAAADLNPPLAGGPVAGGSGRFSPTRPAGPGELGGGGASGFVAQAMDDPPPAQTYTVVRGDSLWAIAQRNGITVRELAAANNLSTSAALQIGQTLTIPRGASAAAPATTAPATAAPVEEGIRYTIMPGDTLGAIARRHQTTVAALKAMNNLTSDMVRVGDTLLIPTGNGTATAATVGAPPAATPAAATATVKHTVVAGDTLAVIARRYNVTVGAVATANNITDPTRLRAGQELTIPGARVEPRAEAPARPTAYPSSYVPPDGEDLDAGLGDAPVRDVPVLEVIEPVRTITLPPAPGGDSSPDAPIFD
jgi:LysM repeat protein